MGLGLGSSCATEWLVISVVCLAGWAPAGDLENLIELILSMLSCVASKSRCLAP